MGLTLVNPPRAGRSAKPIENSSGAVVVVEGRDGHRMPIQNPSDETLKALGEMGAKIVGTIEWPRDCANALDAMGKAFEIAHSKNPIIRKA